MPIIDSTQLKKITAGDQELIADLAIMFVQNLPELKARIRIGIESGDAAEIESGAHQLKSRVSYFGASCLSEQSGKLESAARNSQRADLLKLQESLFEGVDQMIQELRTLTNLALEIDSDETA